MTGSCNDTVEPHQIAATITGGNHPEAVDMRLYGIYELDLTTMSGRIALNRPGMTKYPTDFTPSSSERVFVFHNMNTGNGGAGN